MLLKIISSGLYGTSSAVLDLAVKMGMEHGGWTSKSLFDEQGEKEKGYHLKRSGTDGYQNYTENNIKDADATLVFLTRQFSMACEFVKKKAEKHKKPVLILDLKMEDGFVASRKISGWITENNITILHVTGPGEELCAGVYKKVKKIMEASFFLNLMETGISTDLKDVPKADDIVPETVDQAVDVLEKALSLKDKSTIANMTESELSSLHFTLGEYIQNKYNVYSGNTKLFKDCRKRNGMDKVELDGVSAIIIRSLWLKLKESYTLRVVKH